MMNRFQLVWQPSIRCVPAFFSRFRAINVERFTFSLCIWFVRIRDMRYALFWCIAYDYFFSFHFLFSCYIFILVFVLAFLCTWIHGMYKPDTSFSVILFIKNYNLILLCFLYRSIWLNGIGGIRTYRLFSVCSLCSLFLLLFFLCVCLTWLTWHLRAFILLCEVIAISVVNCKFYNRRKEWGMWYEMFKMMPSTSAVCELWCNCKMDMWHWIHIAILAL